jgi:hypothetical protein
MSATLIFYVNHGTYGSNPESAGDILHLQAAGEICPPLHLTHSRFGTSVRETLNDLDELTHCADHVFGGFAHNVRTAVVGEPQTVRSLDGLIFMVHRKRIDRLVDHTVTILCWKTAGRCALRAYG